MKAQLSKRLTEGKDQYRLEADAEHNESLERLKGEHEKEIDRLKAQHKEELDLLKENEATRFEQFKTTWLAEQSASGDAVQGQIKSETHVSPNTFNPTEPEAKYFVANNPTIREIVRRNITKRINEEREELIAKTKQGEAKLAAEKMDELQKKANKAQENAVQMEAKKYGAKLSMAENRARQASVKIEVVQRAAEETPQRPVGEVWAVAKDAKPPPVVSPQQQHVTARGSMASQAGTSGQPTAIPASPQAQPSTSQGTGGQASAVQAQARPPSAQGSVQQPPVATSTSSAPNSARPAQPPLSNAVPSKSMSQPVPSESQAAVANNTEQIQPPPPTNELPAKPPPIRQLHHPNAGTGPGANRGSVSGIPRGTAQAGRAGRGGRGGQTQVPIAQASQPSQTQSQDQTQNKPTAVRGSTLPRGPGGPGRGRGTQGRGTSQQVQTTGIPQPQNQGPRSPGGRGALNAGARQFVPQGNKRAREDGREDSDGANGKRIKNEATGN